MGSLTINRPAMSEADAWGHAMTRAIMCGADAEHATGLADRAAASVREAHAIADLFEFLEAPSDALDSTQGETP